MSKAKISVVVPIDPRRPTEILASINSQKDKCIPIFVAGFNASENRNKGAREARTDFVAYSNMHSHLADDWSTKVLEFFDRHPEIDIVGGPHLSLKDESFIGRVSGYALGSLFGAAEVSSRYNTKKENLNADEKHITTANLICRKSVIKKIKFDEKLYPGEDPQFIVDAKKNGFKVAYSPNIIVYQRRRDNLLGLAKQIFYYGTARPKKENFATTLTMPSFLVPSVFIIYIALLPTLFLISKFLLLPLLAYIFLNLTFSVYESLKNRDALSAFVLPFAFLTIHVSYGLGYLYGFVQKYS